MHFSHFASLAGAVFLVVALGSAEDPTPQGKAPAIEVRQLAPATVVYLEHTGPYWSMGRLFGRVAELMAAKGESGPMFARYLDDPAQVPVAQLRAQIGFFVADDLETPPEYQREVLPARTVALLTLEGRYGRAPEVYAAVFDWIHAKGYEAKGYVTEVYPAGDSPRRTEIQVEIVVADTVDLTGASAVDYAGMLRRLPAPAAVEVQPAEACVSQLLMRIEAIRLAVSERYPDLRPDVDALLAAMDDSVGSPVGAPVAVWGTSLRPKGAQGMEGAAFASTMAGLDALLVNVTLGRVEPDKLVQRLDELTAWARQHAEGDGQGGAKDAALPDAG